MATSKSQMQRTEKSKIPPLRNEMLTKFFGETEARQRPPSVTIGKPLTEVYSFFRKLTNLPLFMKGLQSVTETGRVSHWRFEEDGVVTELDIELVTEEPNQMMAWKTLGGAEQNFGIATFESAPGQRGTIVSLHMTGEKSPGKVASVASYFASREPKARSFINLRRLKAYLETGEVPTIEGQPNGNDEINNRNKQ